MDQVLDVWYGFVASQPHLVAHFADADGQPIPEYLGRVRARFGQWIRDTCTREYDEQWLGYQEEIARRHSEATKNRTDGVASTPFVPARHLIGLIVPIATTVRPFLATRADGSDDVDALMAAWLKAVVLQVALWTRPYVRDGQW